MASISSLGVGSGLDLTGLLDQLESAERLKLDPITTQKTTNSAKISAYGSLQSALTKLQGAAAALSEAKTYQGQTSTITGSGVKVAATSEAVAGSYQVQVTQLAQAQSLASTGIASKTDDLDLQAGHLTIRLGSESELSGGTANTLTVAIAEGSSLETIRDAINAQAKQDELGVTASIVNAGGDTPYRLVLSSSATGTDAQMNIGYSAGGADAALFNYDSVAKAGAMEQTVAAKDASLTVNGVSITSQSNTVEGALQGVTLTLSAEQVSETLTVTRDTATIKSAVNTFVSAYNGLVSTISSLSSYDADSQTAGTLLSDSTLRSVQNRVRSAITSEVDGDLGMLTSLGITLQLDGTLESDSERLDELLAGDLTALSSFFTGAAGAVDDGFADKLGTTLDEILDEQGMLSTATKGLESRNEELGERYTRLESSIEATIERYRTQFASLDSLIAQMNSTSTYLTQQFDALNAQLGNS